MRDRRIILIIEKNWAEYSVFASLRLKPWIPYSLSDYFDQLCLIMSLEIPNMAAAYGK